jgi:WD repeat-containing protein 35
MRNFVHIKKANYPICALYLTPTNNLYVGISSGSITKYNLSTMKIINRYKIDESIKYLGVSPYERYLWCISKKDYLSIYNIKKEQAEKLEYSQKEVWDLKWCIKSEEDINDDTLEFAILQKNRLFFINNLEIEGEMQKCTDYMASYSNNEVTTIKVGKLNEERNNDYFDAKSYIQKYENLVLKGFNQIIDNGENPNLKEAFDYAIKHPCPTFYNSITKIALDKLDFDTAQKTMLQTANFEGLEFLKNVKNIDNDELKKAEILQYNSNYDEASIHYNKMNRGDLNLAMQMKLGKWDKVTDIMSKGNPNAKDENLKIAYNNFADELMEKKDYDKAEENYKKADNIQGLTNVYFAKEEYGKAAKMLDIIPEDDEYLEEIGDKFNGIGMVDEAVKAYVKYGNITKALEIYVSNNKWGEAIELSRKNDFINMEQLTNKFSYEFIKSGRRLDLIELYNKANMKAEVNKYLNELAVDMRKRQLKPLFIKKIYILAAIELEQYKSKISDSQMNVDENINQKNNEHSESEGSKPKDTNEQNQIKQIKYGSKEIDRILFNHWRGAEAFHYYMLCQAQLYKKQFKEACKTVMRLTIYEKEIGTEEVYRLIALCSYVNKCFKICAEALSILQNLKTISWQKRLKYKDLAESIFIQYMPKNIDEKFYRCSNEECKQLVSEYDIYCKSCGYNFSGCVLSGASIFDHHYFKCKQCHHKTKKVEVKKNPINNCPFCHISLRDKKAGKAEES